LTGLATATFLAFGTLLVLFGANANEIMRSLDLDYANFGLLGSMLSLGLGVGIVVAGPIADRLPRRPLFLASCIVVIAAATTLGPQTTYEGLIVHMIAIGLGAGFYETVINVIIIEKFSDAAGRRLLFIHSGASFAACAAPLIMGFLRESFEIEWYVTFRWAGLLHIPLVVAGYFQSMTTTPERTVSRSATANDALDDFSDNASDTSNASDKIPDEAPDRRANSKLALAAICMATFAYVGVETALTIFVVDHTVTDLDLGATRAARTISAFWGGLLVGRLASGLATRSPGAGATAVSALLGAGLVLGFGLGILEIPELAMAMTGLVLGGVFPVMIGLAGQSLPSSPATAVGLAGGLGSLGGFIIPWYTGRLASTDGLPFAITSLAGWLGLLLVAAVAVRFRRRR
jgi:FHS family glucose/mannose:H+ symporter-like MFS transporter